ncbi:hypothetical protein GCM10029964_081930 [Kibdelosporangium lantanae]
MATAADLAYVLFTSGSTGAPKGAMVHHGGMVNHLNAKVDDVGLAAADRTVQNAQLTFDVSVWQMLGPLVTGGTCLAVDEDTALDATALFAFAATNRATVLEVVPSSLRFALDAWAAGEARPPALPDLRVLVVTGEALPPDLCAAWLAWYPAIRMINAYGPTECSDDVTHAVITPDDLPAGARAPIGRAIRNTRLYVLDRHLRPVPVGVPGELYVGGAGVGYGYWLDPVRTATTFVADPFADRPGDRLYRTGDLVRYLSDGQLEFLRRLDDQTKIRGQRIEPGEIEYALRQLDGVADVAVVVTAPPDRPQDKQLAGYLVADRGTTLDPAAVRAALGERLPEYMIPSSFTVLDALPLSAHGKVDRKALPAPRFVARAGRAPGSALEAALCRVFADVLGVERVFADDGFFDLGGHSLLATRLVSRIRSRFGVELPVRSVFEFPRVANLAEVLTRAGGARAVVTRRERPDPVPVSFAQRRLWFLDRFDGPSPLYNIPLVLRLRGALDVPALRAALSDVVGRHESLRTVIGEVGGEPVQRVVDSAAVPFDTGRGSAAEAVTAGMTHVFDLANDLPIAAWYVKSDVDEHVLVVVTHHIASDGWSAGPLALDLAEAYRARVAGRRRDGRRCRCSTRTTRCGSVTCWVMSPMWTAWQPGRCGTGWTTSRGCRWSWRCRWTVPGRRWRAIAAGPCGSTSRPRTTSSWCGSPVTAA